MNLNGKTIDLALLGEQLAVAGIVLPLGTYGDDLVTFDAEGAAHDLTPAQQLIVAPVIAAHDPERAPARVLRAQVLALAASAVGIRLDNLTAGQQRAILACMAWKAGAVAPDLTVRPLAEWT